MDEWTPREIVHHVADSEMTSAIRLRRLIAEDRPTISGYDEAGLGVLGFQRLEYELTADAIDLGLDAALPPILELESQFGRGERSRPYTLRVTVRIVPDGVATLAEADPESFRLLGAIV